MRRILFAALTVPLFTCMAGATGKAAVGTEQTNKTDAAEAGMPTFRRSVYVCTLKPDPPPVPDGDPGEWNTISTEYQMLDKNTAWGRDEYDGESDLSGTIKLCYDANYLYILADVVDDVLVFKSGVQMLNADHIELDFVPVLEDEARGSIPMNAEMRVIGMTPCAVEKTIDAQQVMENVALLAGPVGIDMSGIGVGGSMTEDGYILEARIPWRVLGIQQNRVKRGEVFGIEVHISDFDTGKRQETMTTLDGREWKGRRYEQIPKFILGGTDGKAE